MWDEFPAEVGADPDSPYRQALRDQVPVRFEEYDQPLDRTLEIRAHPIPNGLAVYFSDVTTARRQDERLRESQRLEAIGRVTAEIGHDFNNLLTVIRTCAQLGQRQHRRRENQVLRPNQRSRGPRRRTDRPADGIRTQARVVSRGDRPERSNPKPSPGATPTPARNDRVSARALTNPSRGLRRMSPNSTAYS